MLRFDDATAALETLRAGESVSARLGDLMKERNLKVSELRDKWDKDGNGKLDSNEVLKHNTRHRANECEFPSKSI